MNDAPFTAENLKRARYIIDFVSDTEPPILCNSEIRALLVRLVAAEELIEASGDLKRSEPASEWLKARGNS